MLTFKEYLELSENDISEGLGSTAAGIADAGVSAAGTFGKQIFRGLGNTAWGGTKAAANVAGSVFGSKESRKKSRENLGSNLGQVTRGVAQAVTSPAAAVWRGVEAGRNPFSAMKSGGGWGEMLGVRKNPQTAPPKINAQPTGSQQQVVRAKKEIKPGNQGPYFIPEIQNDLKSYIENMYDAHMLGKELTLINQKPEVFIKNLMIKYINYPEKTKDLDLKLKIILKKYFSQIKIKNLETPEDLEISLSKGNINRISSYINHLYSHISTKQEEEILLPKNVKSFIKSLKLIHNEVLSETGFNKNLQVKLKELKSRLVEIMNYYRQSQHQHS